MGYFKLAFSGISWMSVLRASTRGLAIIKTIVLARILLPAQFGIYGIATIVLGFLETLTETGINIFLVQKDDDINPYINSAWVVSITRGIIMSVSIIVFAPLIAGFFRSSNATSILYLTAIIPFVRGFINPSCVKFQKSLQFRKQFYYDSSLFLLDTLLAISLAYFTKSENSLIIAMIITAFVEVFISFIVFSPKPKLILDKIKFMEIIKTGKWITGASIANYIFENVDDAFVGRILGSSALGIYQQGYRIASIPASEVGQVFNKVTFPLFVTINNDIKRVKKAFIKTLIVITGLVSIYGLVVFKFADKIVFYLLGDNWIPVIPVLQILAIYGVTKAISNSFFSLFLGIKKEGIVTLTSTIRAVVLISTIYPLIKIFGVLGAGFSAILASVISMPFFIYYAWKNLKS